MIKCKEKTLDTHHKIRYDTQGDNEWKSLWNVLCSMIFTESFLSFLGLGVNAPMPSLGSLASAALNGLQSYPYRLIAPALMISIIILSFNLLGDGLRDAFDPKLKN